jgi:hypothetical protein
VQERSDAENFDKLKDAFIRRIEAVRSEYADDRQFQLDVGRSLSGLQMQRETLFILRWLVSRFLKEQKRRIRRTDATDFFHAVVPAAYCDFVLLDSDWRTGVEQIRSHLNKAGSSIPIARAFSRNEIDRFLCELESSC